MKEVLIIAYLFPPLTGPGMQRTLGFVRHLPANGWRPTVICADDDRARGPCAPELLRRVPHQTTVVRVPARWPTALAGWLEPRLPPPMRAAFGVSVAADGRPPWGAEALGVALRMAEPGGFAAVYSTGGPWANHLIAATLRARLGIPWVADLREPPVAPNVMRRRRAIAALVYRRADRLIARSPGHMRSMQANLRFAGPDKVSLIPDGFAESDFARPRPPRTGRNPVCLGWMAQKRGAKDLPLWSTLADARVYAPPFSLRFIDAPDTADEAVRAGLGDISERESAPTHGRRLDRIGECHATLVGAAAHPRPNGNIPQSLLLQLRLGRPMLAVLPPGDADDLVREAGDQHLIVDPLDDRDAAARATAHWLHRLASDALPDIPADAVVVQRHARDVLTQRLAGLLDSVAVVAPAAHQ